MSDYRATSDGRGWCCDRISKPDIMDWCVSCRCMAGNMELSGG